VSLRMPRSLGDNQLLPALSDDPVPVTDLTAAVGDPLAALSTTSTTCYHLVVVAVYSTIIIIINIITTNVLHNDHAVQHLLVTSGLSVSSHYVAYFDFLY